MLRVVLPVLFFFLYFPLCQAQVQDSLVVSGDTLATSIQEDIPEKEEKFHSPKKALLLSAILPGAGQVYNKKLWKLPIIYVGFGVSAYFLQDNLKNIDYYRTQYRYETDGDPATINESGYGTGQLQDIVTLYKRWRDFSYLSMGLIYVLNVVDAYVDAHLFYFDVSEDISLNIQPYMNFAVRPVGGLSLVFRL